MRRFRIQVPLGANNEINTNIHSLLVKKRIKIEESKNLTHKVLKVFPCDAFMDTIPQNQHQPSCLRSYGFVSYSCKAYSKT